MWAPARSHAPLKSRKPLFSCYGQRWQASCIVTAAMLKITLLDSADELRFRLEGKLSGPWVDELRQCWRTASSTTQGRRTVTDLREIDFVDEAGEALLKEMAAEAVCLEASTPLMRSVVDGIAAAVGYGTVEDKPTSSPHAVLRSDSSRSHSRAL
jgi:hypothetical protein